VEIQTGEQGQLSFIGSDGWYRRGAQRANFDQQPVEALSLIEACIEAFNCTGDEKWLATVKRTFQWFLGLNDLRTPVYDFTTGGCRDGLHPDRVNQNQGAESTLAWLISLFRMYRLKGERTLGKRPSRLMESQSSASVEEQKKEAGEEMTVEAPDASVDGDNE